jgi:hypothetical protein
VKVPASALRPGDVLVLSSGRRVTVERVDLYGDELVVRWWRRADYGEPGYTPRAGSAGFGGRLDGRYLGSLAACPPESLVEVER